MTVNNGWEQWKEHVLFELKRIANAAEQNRKMIVEIDKRQAVNAAKSALIGGTSGGVIIAIVEILKAIGVI